MQQRRTMGRLRAWVRRMAAIMKIWTIVPHAAGSPGHNSGSLLCVAAVNVASV